MQDAIKETTDISGRKDVKKKKTFACEYEGCGMILNKVSELTIHQRLHVY